jgi:hypothetical protein
MERGLRPEGRPATRATVRLLVVAMDEVTGPELIAELRKNLPEAAPAEVMVIAPAVERTAFRHALGDVDSATREAKQRLQASLEQLEQGGIHALGEVGDSDPVTAAQDALREFLADEVLIVAHAGSEARWFENGLFERAQEELHPAVRMIEISHEEGDPSPHVAGVEESGPGRRTAPSAKHELSLSANLPRFARGDLVGIVIAIVGTIVTAVLAATGPPSDSAGGAAQILIAIAVALINMAHVVGLLLFESVHYRGGFQRFFRDLSMTATPLAILVVGAISLFD